MKNIVTIISLSIILSNNVSFFPFQHVYRPPVAAAATSRYVIVLLYICCVLRKFGYIIILCHLVQCFMADIIVITIFVCFSVSAKVLTTLTLTGNGKNNTYFNKLLFELLVSSSFS